MMNTTKIKDYISSWQRFDHEGTAIYISTLEANWFVPNPLGDAMLRSGKALGDEALNPDVPMFLSSLPQSRSAHYKGRSKILEPDSLSELWFHVTNRCNLSCTHCLFSSSPSDAQELSGKRIIEIAEEAYEAGCRLFALTGGEPFVHPDIDAIITTLLGWKGTHVVVLTNGMTLLPFLEFHSLDPDYFHIQISVDGLEENHDRIRSKGTFRKLSANLEKIRERGYPVTLSMCVNKDNVKDMAGFIDFAADIGAANVHFMWYFIRGRGLGDGAPDMGLIYEYMVQASGRAEARNITIDNLEALKTQVFSPPGTIHDGCTAGWESLAVGPDGRLYPSAALVGLPELGSDITRSLIRTWRDSPVLKTIRECSITSQESIFRFMLGGGDMDQSYMNNKTFMGHDPYLDLHEKLLLWMIAQEAKNTHSGSRPSVLVQMGDILTSCGAHGDIAFVHSNCLLATSQNDSLTTVKNFYSAAVGDSKTDILNPVCYDPELLSHIPDMYRFRGYGCGSPVLDAHIKDGDHVVDLGCGSGVECFIAARLSGKKGRVTGVDMLEPMLSLAEKGRIDVEKNLGYQTLAFEKGYLESLPLPDISTDIVLSNCVMNLSVNKRKAYQEIFRILRPGGKLVISDVVCETEPAPIIRNNETLKGECIAGALTESRLMAILENAGFSAISLIKRFPYRNVGGHDFYSLTYQAVKPRASEMVNVMYRGPLSRITAPSGILLPRGKRVSTSAQDAEILGDQVFVMDKHGLVVNIEAQNTCACYQPPDTKPVPASATILPLKHNSGCMVCGASLSYHAKQTDMSCQYCGLEFSSQSICEKGHFVCDACHAQDALSLIRHICVSTRETDMVRLFEKIRNHPSVPVHGPEYHAMIPGIILACHKNQGGTVTHDNIESGITRGSTVAGGYCGFMGICGAAVGVGIAFSILLEANPVKASERQTVQTLVQKVLKEIADLNAARCCQRDGWIALTKIAELSGGILPFALKADHTLVCRQQHKNKECPGSVCPLSAQKRKEDPMGHSFKMIQS